MPWPALTLARVNDLVSAVHAADGLHVGNVKRVGTLWKFKAVGYDAHGAVLPGHGPLTNRHNTAFAAWDAAYICAQLGANWGENEGT